MSRLVTTVSSMGKLRPLIVLLELGYVTVRDSFISLDWDLIMFVFKFSVGLGRLV